MRLRPRMIGRNTTARADHTTTAPVGIASPGDAVHRNGREALKPCAAAVVPAVAVVPAAVPLAPPKRAGRVARPCRAELRSGFAWSASAEPAASIAANTPAAIAAMRTFQLPGSDSFLRAMPAFEKSGAPTRAATGAPASPTGQFSH